MKVISGVAGLVAAALVVAACGSGAEGESAAPATSGGAGITQASKQADTRTAAEKQGEEAGAATGAAVKLEPRTIGVIQVTGSSETMQRSLNAVKSAAAVLGWTVKDCDGRGEPGRFAECARSMLAQKVDAIVSHSIDAAPMKAQMAQARERGIPWLNAGGQVTPNELFTASVEKDETAVGGAAGEFLKEKLGGQGTVAMTESPSNFSLKIRGDSGRQALLNGSSIKIVASHDVDLANLVQDARTWSSTVVTRFPKLDGFLFTVVTDVLAVAPVVERRYGDTQPPERPYLVGNGGDLANIDLVRKGLVDAVVDAPSEPFHWMSVDLLAQYFARNTAIPREPVAQYPKMVEPQVVTKDNVPADPKEYPPVAFDFVSYFKSKWAKEFGTS
jgi:ribose transport system substrate-binding protein